MAVISKGGTLPDTGVTKAQVYKLVDNAVISGITKDDIASNAGIVDTQLAQITTASKVNISAITGVLPVANGGTGTTAAIVSYNVTASRAVNANSSSTNKYQNTTGRPIHVFVVVEQAAWYTVRLYVDANNPPSTGVSGMSGGATPANAPVTLQWWVPNNYWYTVISDYTSCNLFQWIESY